MSTMPPPPPPFGSAQGPFANPAAYDKRALKAQRREAARQALLLRNQLRAQQRAMRRKSIVGPLLLVGLGVVLLLLTTGRLYWGNALLWLGRWWPAVLIVAGLVMVAEWALDRGRVSTEGASLAPTRFLGAGTVFLLILLALVGAAVMTAENGSAWARENLDRNFAENGWGDWQKMFGVGSEITQDLSAPLANDGVLLLDDPRGDVTVTGSSQDGQVHVTLHRHMYLWDQNEVDRRRRAGEAHFEGNRSRLTLATPSQDKDRADLTVELPHGASVTLHSGHGDVNLEEIRGAVDVSAHGDVKLTALSGPVRLETQDDNADITAHSLGGGLTLSGHSGDINLSDITGAVTLQGDFFGTTHLERVHGPVHFQSSFTRFDCASLPGELNVEGRSDLNAAHLEGPVIVATTNRNLTLNGVRGGATITDRNGSVNLTLAGTPAATHVSNENGSVVIAIPTTGGYALQANTQNGEIQDDFGLVAQKAGQTVTVKGTIGSSGPALKVETTEGDVHIHKATSTEDANWGDDAQRITPTPSHAKGAHKTPPDVTETP